MTDDHIIEEMARAIYDELEGPVNTADAMRQMRQWERAKAIATAALAAYRNATTHWKARKATTHFQPLPPPPEDKG